jgi:acetyl-CoA carboxylase biotin carboxylase subunit
VSRRIRTLLIANRGEIAVRIIRACRERGVRTVAIFSDADAGARHVRLADAAVHIGPAAAASSYLDRSRVIAAATSSGADAIHPGYGFLSENPDFAAACEAAGLIFVGPPSDVIRRMGSKIEARRIMAEAGVPIVPGEVPADQTDEGIRAAALRVNLPVLLKPSAGGGGKGMRAVRDAKTLVEAIQASRREATAAFGDGTLYVERLIERAHHVEVQIFGDAHGHTVHLFERECSVQRRQQKVIEESPSPSIDDSLQRTMAAAAVTAAAAAGYRNAGTVEFLVDPAARAFYFLEVNARLQVEHPVTEMITGLDLVHAQFDVAEGAPLPWTQDAVARRGHAIEARIYAEDPDRGFVPQSGRLLRYREPRMPGVRVDGGVAEGDTLTVHYDPLLAKVIASAETRTRAIDRLREALRDFPVLGVRTNIPYLLRVIEDPRFRSGEADIGFLEREADTLAPTAQEQAMPEVVRIALDAAPDSVGSAGSNQLWDPWSFVESGSTGSGSTGSGSTDSRSADARVDSNALGASSADSVVVARSGSRRWAFWRGHVYVDEPAPTSGGTRSAAHAGTDTAATLTAPMPGTVLKILVAPGAQVVAGQPVAILEAMKMELPVRAIDNGVVKRVLAAEGTLVQADAPLVEIG